MIRKKNLIFLAVAVLVLATACHRLNGQQSPHVNKATETQPHPSFLDCPDCPEMVSLPAGTVLMGAGLEDAKGFIEEAPQHPVRVESFSVSKFDLTRGQWKSFVDATSRTTSTGCGYSGLPSEEGSKASWQYLGFRQDDRHPVVCVTFQDAVDYAL